VEIDPGEMRIKKTNEDKYHVVVNGQFTKIDEEVNAPQLQGMLHWRQLFGITCGELLKMLEVASVGYHISVRFERVLNLERLF